MKIPTLYLHIDGASCASCVQKIEGALKQVAGVDDAVMNLADSTVTVTFTTSDGTAVVGSGIGGQDYSSVSSVLTFAPGSSGARDFRRLGELVLDLPALTDVQGQRQFFFERLLEVTQEG